MKRFTLCIQLAFLLVAFVGGPLSAQKKEVTIGYQLVLSPWIAAVENGDFEKATGYKINWRLLDTPAKVLSGMASGRVHIGVLGSTGVATAISRVLDVELFWILDSIGGAEALVVHKDSGINEPNDLIGKKLGVPFVSTTHFHTLAALDHYGIPPQKVKILNMPPNAIAAAWARGDIDAAFVWNPALSRIKQSGRVLITSGELGRLGKPTFDGLLANQAFSAKHPEFMAEFIRVVDRIDTHYRENTAAWTPDSTEIKALSSRIGGKVEDIPEILSGYGFPNMQEQISETWLGGGKNSGAAKALLATAQFLKQQKKIPRILDDYSQNVNPEWVKRAMKK